VPYVANDPAWCLTGRYGFGRDQENFRDVHDSQISASSLIDIQFAKAPAKRYLFFTSKPLAVKYQHAVLKKRVVDFAKRLIVERFADIDAGNFRAQRMPYFVHVNGHGVFLC
jgi:hypothetical protein